MTVTINMSCSLSLIQPVQKGKIYREILNFWTINLDFQQIIQSGTPFMIWSVKSVLKPVKLQFTFANTNAERIIEHNVLSCFLSNLRCRTARGVCFGARCASRHLRWSGDLLWLAIGSLLNRSLPVMNTQLGTLWRCWNSQQTVQYISPFLYNSQLNSVVQVCWKVRFRIFSYSNAALLGDGNESGISGAFLLVETGLGLLTLGLKDVNVTLSGSKGFLKKRLIALCFILNMIPILKVDDE